MVGEGALHVFEDGVKLAVLGPDEGVFGGEAVAFGGEDGGGVFFEGAGG